MILARLPSGLLGRALASSLAFATFCAFYQIAFSPAWRWFDARATYQHQQNDRLSRERHLVTLLPALRREVKEADAHAVRSVLPGDSDAVAGAELQQNIDSISKSVKARLVSVETLAGAQVADFRRVGVHVQLRAPYPVIIALLSSISDASPRMIVDEVHLAATPVESDSSQPLLDASFSVLSFRAGLKEDTTP
jgi:hypothetical protein